MRMKMRSLTIGLLLACLCLLGCASAETIVGPDGTENQLVTCTAIKDCYEKAREVCGGVYKIVNTSSETNGVYGTTSTDVNLLVKCGRQKTN